MRPPRVFFEASKVAGPLGIRIGFRVLGLGFWVFGFRVTTNGWGQDPSYYHYF